MSAADERLLRLENDVSDLKSDLSQQKVSLARIAEQVSSHESQGVERHKQVIAAIADMKEDYRTLLIQQAQDARAERKAHADAASERLALVGKITLGILGIIGTVVASVYGLSP